MQVTILIETETFVYICSYTPVEMCPLDLPSYLFWDCDPAAVDPQEHKRFIIHRVIHRGEINHWHKIKTYYGLEIIKEEMLQMRTMEKKTLNLFSLFFEVDKTEFRCYSTQQSNLGHYDY